MIYDMTGVQHEYNNKTETQKRKKVYISGKMTGEEYLNFPLFNKVEFFLRQKYNFDVVNPATLSLELIRKEDPNYYIDPENYEEIMKKLESLPQLNREYYLAYDIFNLASCDYIAFIDGWKESSGARLEYNFAKIKGIKCYSLEKNFKLKEI